MGTSSESVFNGSGKGYLPARTIGNRTHILSERLKAGTEFKRLKRSIDLRRCPQRGHIFCPISPALPCSVAETASGGTRRYQNASLEASSRYSHSFTLVCRCVNPVNSSWVVDLGRLATESRRVSPRKRSAQILGQIRKLFVRTPTANPQFHFCPGDKNGLVLRAQNTRIQEPNPSNDRLTTTARDKS